MGSSNISPSNANKNFQIAILIEDLGDAKNLSDGLRELGIFAHYYQDLDEMWVSLNTYTPDFCIVDVKKMSQGTLLFKHHPKVKDASLKYSFYYRDSSKILLRSTYGLDHYGYIRAELDLVDQLRSVLRRRNYELKLTEENINIKRRFKRLRLRGKRLVELQEKSSFQASQDEMLGQLIRSFGVVETVEDFKRRVVTTFDQWDCCLEFGLYELNSTGQKLISPKFNRAKYKDLPDLWLSKRSEAGIDTFAQEMAHDVAYGVLDEGVLAIRVQGAHIDPDFLIMAQLNKEAVKGMNWEYLEMKLSSEYRRAQLRSQIQPESGDHYQSQFELMQAMDDITFNQASSPYRHVLVDFSRLIGFVKQRPTNRFFWKSFAQDFTNEVSAILSGDFKLTAFGAGHFVAAIEKRFVETDYTNLKTYLESFEYWRYFEDSSLVVSNDVRPQLRLMAPSSVNLMRQVDEGESEILMAPVEREVRLEM